MSHSHAQIVAWLLPLVAPVAPALRDAAHHRLVDERLEALQAAAQCGLTGMVAVEAAMTAIRLRPGEMPPALTGVQLIAEERQRQIDQDGHTAERMAVTWPWPEYEGTMASVFESQGLLAEVGAICAARIDLLDYLEAQAKETTT